MSLRQSMLLLSVVAAVSAPATAAAQSPSPLPIESGQRIWVTLAAGPETNGVVEGMTPVALLLKTERGTQTINLADLRKIEKPDSVKNGTMIGAVTGIVWGGFGGGFKAGNRGNYLELIGAATLVGALIDKRIDGRDLVWTHAPAATLHIAPVATRHSAGLRASLRW